MEVDAEGGQVRNKPSIHLNVLSDRCWVCVAIDEEPSKGSGWAPEKAGTPLERY